LNWPITYAKDLVAKKIERYRAQNAAISLRRNGYPSTDLGPVSRLRLDAQCPDKFTTPHPPPERGGWSSF
jgi:hypothetical protein